MSGVFGNGTKRYVIVLVVSIVVLCFAAFAAKTVFLRNGGTPADRTGLMQTGNTPTEYYVAANGVDTNHGTEDLPFRTIQKAVNIMQSGDKVYVKEGNYDERIYVNKSGTADNYLSIEAYPSSKVVTRGFTIGTQLSKPQSYIRIKGFEITNTPNHWRDKIGISPNGDHIEIVDNYIHHINGDGIYARGSGTQSDFLIQNNKIAYARGMGIVTGGSNWLLENNDISHGTNIWNGVASGDADAIRVFGNGHIIRGNYLHDFLRAENNLNPKPHMDGFQTFDTCQNILIENNTVIDIQGQWVMLNGGYKGPVDHIIFRNNVFARNSAYGFMILKVPYLTVQNNTFADPFYGAIFLRQGSSNATIRDNIFYDKDPMRYSPYSIEDTASKVGLVADYSLAYPVAKSLAPAPIGSEPHHRWGLDPKFKDLSKDDYHLQASSGAIDAGTSEGAPSKDKDGTVRYDDPYTANNGCGEFSYYDIGAYEFKGP